MDYLAISKRYLDNFFLFDILGILPFIIRIIFNDDRSIWLFVLGDCLIFTKSVLLLKKMKRLFMIFTVKETLHHWMELTKLISSILFLAHILAIIYHVKYFQIIFKKITFLIFLTIFLIFLLGNCLSGNYIR